MPDDAFHDSKKYKSVPIEDSVIDLSKIEVENNLGESSELEKDYKIQDNNIIQKDIYNEGVEAMLYLIVKYKYYDITMKPKTKGKFLLEILEIFKKYNFIAQEMTKNMSDKLLRSIFPYVEIYNKIIESYKVDYSVTIIQEDMKDVRASKKKYRNDYLRQKQLFIKCGSLFKSLKIFDEVGILNVINGFCTSGADNKRILRNNIIFLTNICKYADTQNLKWFISVLLEFKIFHFLFTKKIVAVIELLEVIKKRLENILVTKVDRRNMLYNVPVEEMLKNKHQRIVFREKLILKDIENKKYAISSGINSERKIFDEILQIFENINLQHFFPIDKIEADSTKSIYFSGEIISYLMNKHKNELLEFYDQFICDKSQEFAKKVGNLLEVNETEHKSIIFSTEFGEFENVSSSELSNCEGLNTLEKKELKNLRDIIKDDSSETEVEGSSCLDNLSSSKTSIARPSQNIIDLFYCLKNFENVSINKDNIDHAIKQIEFFNATLFKNLEQSLFKLSSNKNPDEKALLSPVFYSNIDIYLKNTFYKQSNFKEKRIVENFNDYWLFAVVVYYNHTFLKELSFFDFESFKNAAQKKKFLKVLENQQFISNSYIFLEQTLKTCEIKDDSESCFFCKHNCFEKCKIYYIINMLSVSLVESESFEVKSFHFKISQIFIVYGLFDFIKKESLKTRILKFCNIFLNEFIASVRKDIFMFGKVFFNFNNKQKKKSALMHLKSNETVIEDYVSRESKNLPKDTPISDTNEGDLKSVFKRLKKNVLDDD
ncbi:hypothetical protein CDIK_0024 [Cucumispora dikerogammari]|nr:hypothetical protein CDIK_0024 [Cucumispora dikerogammari]